MWGLLSAKNPNNLNTICFFSLHPQSEQSPTDANFLPVIGRDLQPISGHTNTVCSGLPVCGLTLQCVDLEIGKLKSAGFSVG